MGENYDKVINLTNSIEYGAIAMEDQNIYYQSDRVRREAFGDINYYDIAIDMAGLPKELRGTTGEMYFKDSEVKVIEDWVSKYKDRFKVLINLSGTSLHKIFINAKGVAEEIRRKYGDAVVILTGDKTCEPYDFSKEVGCISTVGKNSIRHVILLAKYMDCVIGCESGLMVASNMWETPTIQLLTAANHNNHPKYAQNDYSMQSNIRCSPCHKGPYKYLGCPKTNNYPACIYGFPTADIMKRVDHIYASR